MDEFKTKAMAAVEAARQADKLKEDERKKKITVSMEAISAARIKANKKGK